MIKMISTDVNDIKEEDIQKCMESGWFTSKENVIKYLTERLNAEQLKIIELNKINNSIQTEIFTDNNNITDDKQTIYTDDEFIEDKEDNWWCF